MSRTIRIEDLLDRHVIDERGTRIGRIHEIVARRERGRYVVTEYRLGSGALIDRFELTRWIFGGKPKPIVVPADQLDITSGSADCILRPHGKAAD
jgi:sporulation protein YlmC with PRC-barrel domain